jgi:hypothetical protein
MAAASLSWWRPSRGRRTTRRAGRRPSPPTARRRPDGRSRAAAPKPGVRVGALQMRAASLLVYQSVVKGAVGEAFLGVLAATLKYQARLGPPA